MPKPIAVADLPGDLDDRLGVAPLELNPARILVGEDSVLVALDGEGHGAGGADRIQPLAVADLVAGVDRGEVVVQAHRAERAEGLVLGLVVIRLEGAVFDLGFAAAGDRASPAGVFLFLDREDLVVADLLHAGEIVGRAGPVLDRRVAGGAGAGGHPGRAVLAEDLEHPLLFHPFAILGDGLLHALGVGQRDRRVAHGDDRLEPLRAHHGAQPAAARGPALVVDHRGQQAHPLAGRPDAGQAGLLAVLLLDRVFQVVGVEAPPGVGRKELGPAVIQEEIDGSALMPRKMTPSKPAALHDRAERSPGIGVAPSAGFRALGHDEVAVAAQGGRAGEHAGEEPEMVLGPEGVDARFLEIVEVVRPQAVTSEILQVGLVAGSLDGDRLLGQIDHEDLAHRSWYGHRFASFGSARLDRGQGVR